MQKTKNILLLILLSALLLTGAILAALFPAKAMSVFALPFAPLADGLRALAALGKLGNGLAAALWLGVSLLPLTAAFGGKQKRRAAEIAAWCLLSAALLFGLYALANPGLLVNAGPVAGETLLASARTAVGVTIWSLLLLCAALRITERIKNTDNGKRIDMLRAILYLCGAGLAAAAVYTCGGALYTALRDADSALPVIYGVVRFCAQALPYALDIAVIAAALRLLAALKTETRDAVPETAAKLAARCRVSLLATAGATAAFNLLQLILMRRLPDVQIRISVPILSAAFLLCVLILSELLAENKRLKEDNELFI